MKILWLSHLIPYPPKAGVLLRSYNLVNELARHHQVDLLSFIQKGFMESFFSSYEAGIDESRKIMSSICDTVEFVPIPCESRLKGNHLLALQSLFTRDPYSINWLKSDQFKKSLKSFLNNKQYDAVHFDTISLCPYRHLIPDRTATTLDHHNIESHMMLRRADKEKNFFLKAYYRQEGNRLRRYEQKLCPTFDLNITCSELDSRRLLEVCPGLKTAEIPNGVDLEYFKPRNNQQQENSLIFVGSMNWYPNIEAMHFFVSEIWPLLLKEVPDCILNIVGASPPESIKQLGRDNSRIKIHGFVDDVRPYMEQSAVYICPIRDGGGTKLKLLDAFAMEKAVVAHPIACEGIDATPGRDVFFAETTREFVEKITTLFADEQLRYSMGKNARKMVQAGYSYNSIGKKLATLFEQICR